MTKVTTTPTHPIVYPYQQVAFDRLCAIARAYIHTNFDQLPVKPRGNVFIIGPSGTGKTHLAEQVAHGSGMDLAYLPISVCEWVVLGASQRGAPSTWPTIWKFLQDATQREGCIIFLDELDKVASLKTQGEWMRFQTTETFALLDRKIPRNLNDLDGDKLSEKQIGEAENVLRTKTLIIAGGAFQEIWDTPDPIGFGAAPGTSNQTPDLKRLADYIPTELSRRFGSQLITLPRLQEDDYLYMLGQILPTLPDHWRSPYERMARAGIPEAARLGQGPRFYEELLLEVAVQERLQISSPVMPQPAALTPALVGEADMDT